MKKVKKDVKSKGTVLCQVEVTVYETLEEAVKASSKDIVLAAYNKTVSDAITNTARSEKTRTSSPIAQLARLAKADPKVAAEIEKILAAMA